MSRRFKTADYAATLEVRVRLGDCLPPEHLARFVVDALAQLDLSGICARYGSRGGEAYAPEILVGFAVLWVRHGGVQQPQDRTGDL